jgi:hypothetical protein
MRTILFVAALALGSANPLAAASEDGAKAEQQIIPLYMSARTALVMLRVGDHPPAPVVFDSGTGGNSVSMKLAETLGLPNTGPSRYTDGNGKAVAGHATIIADASLGGVAIGASPANVSAYAFDMPDEAGIFGVNSFPDKFVRFDGPGSRLIIQPRTPATTPSGAPFPYLKSYGAFGTALPSAVLDFGALQVPAILDTGNTSSIILPLAYKDRIALQSAPVQVGFAVSSAQKLPVYRARLQGSVRIGEATLDQPEIYFMETKAPNIGFPIIRRLSVVFDPSGQRDWVLPSEAPKTP